MRYRACDNGTEFRDSDLGFGENFEEERLEFLIGPVDLVDQQHR
jgi:hypothetical protein